MILKNEREEEEPLTLITFPIIAATSCVFLFSLTENCIYEIPIVSVAFICLSLHVLNCNPPAWTVALRTAVLVNGNFCRSH
jgi:hypothetical protein